MNFPFNGANTSELPLRFVQTISEHHFNGINRLNVFSFRHPGDNPFYSNIDSMPDIRPRRKSVPLVSELVCNRLSIKPSKQQRPSAYAYRYVTRSGDAEVYIRASPEPFVFEKVNKRGDHVVLMIARLRRPFGSLSPSTSSSPLLSLSLSWSWSSSSMNFTGFFQTGERNSTIELITWLTRFNFNSFMCAA